MKGALQGAALLAGLLTAAGICAAGRQAAKPDEKEIEKQIFSLRSVPDAQRGSVTKDLALQIRRLPSGEGRLMLAFALANLSTEGDFGHDTLQEVATTLADTLSGPAPAGKQGDRSAACFELAELASLEHVKVSLSLPEYAAAVSKLAAIEKSRRKVDFTLSDLEGANWTLSSLKGKIVLVNFWATWCPPCRKEMPDLQALFDRYNRQGLVVLAISDEDPSKINPFIADKRYTFPILVDAGRKVNDKYSVDGIPKTFIYDRTGRLVAESMDMRTRRQLLDLLAKAGLKTGL
ncbi:MAG TPA: TlpA disulfide reductase family protein [Fimbriimonas sp.]|nr:TlpA disulfide reductase family protein [Fimbriimonas sp.]